MGLNFARAALRSAHFFTLHHSLSRFCSFTWDTRSAAASCYVGPERRRAAPRSLPLAPLGLRCRLLLGPAQLLSGQVALLPLANLHSRPKRVQEPLHEVAPHPVHHYSQRRLQLLGVDRLLLGHFALREGPQALNGVRVGVLGGQLAGSTLFPAALTPSIVSFDQLETTFSVLCAALRLIGDAVGVVANSLRQYVSVPTPRPFFSFSRRRTRRRQSVLPFNSAAGRVLGCFSPQLACTATVVYFPPGDFSNKRQRQASGMHALDEASLGVVDAGVHFGLRCGMKEKKGDFGGNVCPN